MAILLAGTFLLRATPQKDNEPLSTFAALTLDIGLTKDEFAPLEPIPMVLKLENRTKRAVLGHDAIRFSENHIELFVIPSSGPVKKFDIAKPVRQLVEVGRIVFQPGESYRVKDLLTIGMNDILSEPGEYQIQVVAHGANWFQEVKSNLLRLHITEPTGANRRALNLIRSESALPNKFAGYDLSENRQAFAILEALSNDFSETVYSDYASFRVGEFYFFTKSYAKAREYLDKLANKTDFIFANKVSDHLNKLKGELSKESQQSQ